MRSEQLALAKQRTEKRQQKMIGRAYWSHRTDRSRPDERSGGTSMDLIGGDEKDKRYPRPSNRQSHAHIIPTCGSRSHTRQNSNISGGVPKETRM